MEKAGITMGKFIAGLVIAILVSSAVSAAISTQLLVAGPEGPQGETGATGATGPEGPPGPQGPYLPDYDSGWLDITNEAGKYFNVTHNLNSEDLIVDIRGKATASSGAHQRHYGIMSNTQWTKTYGGAESEDAYSVVQTADGGYALAGHTDSYGAGGDFWLVKTDAPGSHQWNKTYGGADYDSAYSVVQTADGGYALAGTIGSFGAGDFWLVKTDSAGNQLWNQTFGGENTEYAWSVVQTADGGYALAGLTYSFGAGGGDFWLVKTDSAGNALWNRTYGGTGWEEARSMVQTADGGYALAGHTNSFGAGGSDFWLVKTDSAGNQLWNQTFGGASAEDAYSVVQTADGGYALAGETNSFGAGDADFWLVKTDSAGNHQWNKTYGGTGWEEARSMVQTADGGYALAGHTSSYGAGGRDFWLVKTDSAGNQQWTKTDGGASDDAAYSLVQTVDGGYALAGYTYSFGAGGADFWLVKTDVESGLAWTDSTANTITLYRGATDIQWNYVQVRIWKID
ncbi:MAG: hypothetical protein ACETVQ_02490 [Candidatus Bathyarchaeia archaeon]